MDISTGKLMFRRRTKGGRLAWSPAHGSYRIQQFEEDNANGNRVSLFLQGFHCTGYRPYWRDHMFIGNGQSFLHLGWAVKLSGLF